MAPAARLVVDARSRHLLVCAGARFGAAEERHLPVGPSDDIYRAVMSLRTRLMRLDAKVIRSFRQPGEDAETHLRRVAARGRAPGAPEAYALQQALREHFAALDAERTR